jgi:L-ribulose-5-phosphate 3-epimerase
MNRRDLLKAAGIAAVPPPAFAQAGDKRFRISLAEWSLHKAIQSRLITNLDFPRIAREHFGIEGLEFVNALWEAPTESYISRLRANMRKAGTAGVLIMCDGEGAMGHPEKPIRLRAGDNHRKWVDIAAELGCHSIRTNMYPGEAQPRTRQQIDAFIGYCAESFARLCDYAAGRKINVLIENHGGISSNADVVSRLMKQVNLPNFGTLPDFGNFPKDMDRYDAVKKLMPFARGVSFKCFDFDVTGKETTMDMDRLMQTVSDSAYKGWVGIEYEGERLTEFEGIQAAKKYLAKWT